MLESKETHLDSAVEETVVLAGSIEQTLRWGLQSGRGEIVGGTQQLQKTATLRSTLHGACGKRLRWRRCGVVHGRGGRGGDSAGAVERATHGRAMGGHCAAAIRSYAYGWHSDLSQCQSSVSSWHGCKMSKKKREREREMRLDLYHGNNGNMTS